MSGSEVPVAVSGLTNATAIAIGGDHSLAIGPPLARVTGLAPDGGPPAGGSTVTITGTGFSGATAVKFGSTNATSFTVNSENSITAISSPGTAGSTVDVAWSLPGVRALPACQTRSPMG